MIRLMNAETLGEHLDLSAEQIRRLTRDDLIPYHRISGATRYNLADVLAATRAYNAEPFRDGRLGLLREIFIDAREDCEETHADHLKRYVTTYRQLVDMQVMTEDEAKLCHNSFCTQLAMWSELRP